MKEILIFLAICAGGLLLMVLIYYKGRRDERFAANYFEEECGECAGEGWVTTTRVETGQEGQSFDVFARINRERCESPKGFNHRLDSWSTSDWFTAILGEFGEAANIAKKLNRVRDGIRGNKETEQQLRDKLRQELGDTFVYLDLLAQSLGFKIGDAALEVFDSKSKELGYAASLGAPERTQENHDGIEKV